jgi:hypothetical protein
MSQPAPNIVTADGKAAITTPTEKEEVSKTEVLGSGPSSPDPFFLEFDNKDAEWHKAFEKKLMRKVDMRLIPLLIIMYLNNFVGTSKQHRAIRALYINKFLTSQTAPHWDKHVSVPSKPI